MPDFDRWPAGNFCWIDLSTTDLEGASRFYGSLFGWQYNDIPMGPEAVYRMPQIRGRDIAGMSGLQPEQRAQGVPPHWLSYVSVADADATSAKIGAAGGAVVMPPFDVMDVGRMAIAQDPTGAMFALWQPRSHPGYRVAAEHGSICWTELATPDPSKAGAFYTQVFGWTPQAWEGAMPYTMFQNEGQSICGMFQLPAEMAGVPPHWMPYFAVDDCDASAALGQQLGGTMIMPPTDIPEIGRFATLQDPQGAVFSVIKLAGM